MELLVIGIVIALFVGIGWYISSAKGRSPVEGVALGCLLGPIGWLIAAVLPSPTPPLADPTYRRPQTTDEWPRPRPGAARPAPSTWAPPAPTARPQPVAPTPMPTKKCPDCAELVQADARICRFCRHEFAPAGTVAPPEGPGIPAAAEPVSGPWSVVNGKLFLAMRDWSIAFPVAGRYRCLESTSARWFLKDAKGQEFTFGPRGGGMMLTRVEGGGGGQIDTPEYSWWAEPGSPTILVLGDSGAGPVAIFDRLLT